MTPQNFPPATFPEPGSLKIATPLAVAVSIPPAPTNADPVAHAKHFNLGQALGLIFLGIQAYNLQDQPGGGPKILLTPQNSTSIFQGLFSIFG